MGRAVIAFQFRQFRDHLGVRRRIRAEHLSKGRHNDALDHPRGEEVRVHDGGALPAKDLSQLIRKQDDVEQRLKQTCIELSQFSAELRDICCNALVPVVNT